MDGLEGDFSADDLDAYMVNRRRKYAAWRQLGHGSWIYELGGHSGTLVYQQPSDRLTLSEATADDEWRYPVKIEVPGRALSMRTRNVKLAAREVERHVMSLYRRRGGGKGTQKG